MEVIGKNVQGNTSDEEGVDLNETDPPVKTRVYHGFMRVCYPFGIHMSVGPDCTLFNILVQLAKMTFIFLLIISGAC